MNIIKTSLKITSLLLALAIPMSTYAADETVPATQNDIATTTAAAITDAIANAAAANTPADDLNTIVANIVATAVAANPDQAIAITAAAIAADPSLAAVITSAAVGAAPTQAAAITSAAVAKAPGQAAAIAAAAVAAAPGQATAINTAAVTTLITSQGVDNPPTVSSESTTNSERMTVAVAVQAIDKCGTDKACVANVIAKVIASEPKAAAEIVKEIEKEVSPN
jgi:hypothetical protein